MVSVLHIIPNALTRFGLPNALSHCGKNILLSMPSTVQIRHLVGDKQPPVGFLRAPPHLKDLQALPAQDVYIAWDANSDIITWNGRTGTVLHFLNNQDFGKT